MKRVLLLGLILLLVACGSDKADTEPIEQNGVEMASENDVVKNEPTQEELNEQLKTEAMDADFVSINGDEVEEGAKLKVTGEISFVSGEGVRGGNFTITTEEKDGHGMYNIINLNTADPVEIVEGIEVTVYGTYSGKDETGIPEITATIIE